jgi:predicted DsbA family dithiol-disulfide isomerase
VRIERLRKNYEIEIQWRAFPLHPEIPEEGLTLEELFAGRRMDADAMMLRLKKVADELGLPLGKRKMTFNSRLAQELAKWAETRGRGDEFHEAVFRAYFVEGRNIGKVEELVDLAKSVGLSEQEAKTVLQLRRFREAVDSDWSRARAMAISAVPTFVLDNQSVVGAQPYEVLEQFLKKNNAKRRNAEPSAFDF